MFEKYLTISFLLHSVLTIDIAIVGGGIGGTSCAYFLNEILQEDVKIDLYESSVIGGRLSTITVDGDEYEVGGTIIHSKNNYAVDLIKAMNLTKQEDDDNELMGLFGDNGFVFVSSLSNFINYFKLLWRYKWDIIKLNRYLYKMLDDFSHIYFLQENSKSYETVQSLLRATNSRFLNYLTESTKEGFLKDGFSETIIDELILAGLRCNYGQSTLVHQFVGSVSTAGAGSELFSISGGNKQLPVRLLNSSGANLLYQQVKKVEKTEENRYKVVVENSDPKFYDYVIIATPLTKDQKMQIEFNVDLPVSVPGHYHTTISTIVKGTLNHTYFGVDDSTVPDQILTTSNKLFFNSISNIKSTSGLKKYKHVWKIFSNKILSDMQLKLLFKKYTVIDTIDWLAYPHYGVEHRNDSFRLDKNLYYINAIEWGASAIEMSLIGAKNVALLLYKDLKATLDFEKLKRKHEEL